MAAANWVCRALLLSLCVGMCYGNRAAGQYTTMHKNAKEMAIRLNHGNNNINRSKHEVLGESSSSRRPGNGGDGDKKHGPHLPVGLEGVHVHCSPEEDSCDDHITVPDPIQFIVGCQQLHGYSQCLWRMDDVDVISELLLGIKQKLDETCWRPITIDMDSMGVNATAPKSG